MGSVQKSRIMKSDFRLMPSPPVMTAEAEHAVSIDQADTIPGTATIVIQNDAHPNLSNRYTIQFTRNPAIGEPPNHLKYLVRTCYRQRRSRIGEHSGTYRRRQTEHSLVRAGYGIRTA